MDELVNILNNDKIVAAGETLLKHGENVLDAIEGVSGNKVVDDVVQIAERAGITKDSVMQGIEKLDVNEILVRSYIVVRGCSGFIWKCDSLIHSFSFFRFRIPLEMQ